MDLSLPHGFVARTHLKPTSKGSKAHTGFLMQQSAQLARNLFRQSQLINNDSILKNQFRAMTAYVLTLLVISVAVSSSRAAGKLSHSNTPSKHLAICGFAMPDDELRVRRADRHISDLLVAALSTNAQIKLIERRTLDKALSELSLSATSKISLLEAARFLKAEALLMGSWIPGENSDTLIARLVHTETGMVIDFESFEVTEADLDDAVSALSRFVFASLDHSPPSDSWSLVGIGGLENLGVNDRFPDLRKRLRSALEEAAKSTGIRFVERSQISPMLTEWKLNEMGLIQPGAKTNHAFLPSVFVLDGVYQALVKESLTIELVMRLQVTGGRQQLLTFRGPPTNDFYREVALGIVSAATATPSKPAVSPRQEEARLQLEIGRKRVNLPEALGYNASLGKFSSNQEPQKRLRNILEAIESFETAVLLDPDLDEARLYLARCLLDSSINRAPEAREYLSEIIARGSTNQVAVQFFHGGRSSQPIDIVSRWWLGRSYVQNDDLQALEVLRGMERDFASDPEIGFYKGATRDVLQRLVATRQVHWSEWAKVITDEFLPQCAQMNAALEKGELFDGWSPIMNYLGGIRGPCYDGAPAAEAYVDKNFLQPLRKSSPALLPYAETLVNCLWSTPSEEDVSRLTQWVNRGPESNPSTPPFRWKLNSLKYVLNWALKSGRFALTVELAVACQKCPEYKWDPEVIVQHGAALMAQKKWDAALAVLEPLARTVVHMPARWDGPWGKAHNSHIAPQSLVDECRRNLGLNATTPAPKSIDLGAPLFELPDPFPFAYDNGRLWIGDGPVPCTYDIAERELIPFTTPYPDLQRIQCVSVGGGRVWFGTHNGLLEFNPSAKTWKRYSEKDGLSLKSVTALAFADDKLWIGFGKIDRGALGYLDLKTQTFKGLAQSWDSTKLAGGFDSLQKTRDHGSTLGPPQNRVIGLVPSREKGIWAAVRYRNLSHYDCHADSWSDSTIGNHEALWCFAGNDQYLVFGGLGFRGGMGGVKLSDRSPMMISLSAWVPNELTRSVALDGSVVWIGGSGWIGAYDLAKRTMLRCEVFTSADLRSRIEEKDCINAIAVTPDGVWVERDSKLFHIKK